MHNKYNVLHHLLPEWRDLHLIFTFLLRASWRIRLQWSVATPSGLLQLVLPDSMMTIPCCFFPFQLFFSSWL